jgi:N-acyl-D-amino-acid deacylase
MKKTFCFIRAALLCTALGFVTAAFAESLLPSDEIIKAAVTKSLPFLEAGARGSMEKRKQCFTCHNQALPIMALTIARSRGLTVNAEMLRQQVQFTADFLAKNRTNYSTGKARAGRP